MPIIRHSNGKYSIGIGKAIYTSKAAAQRAYRGYLAKKHSKNPTKHNPGTSKELGY